MQLLANENIPGDVVTALRDLGHDVKWVREDAPGCKDHEILRQAVKESSIVLTLDKDFGELAFRQRLPAQCGVILLRLEPQTPALQTQLIQQAFQSRDDWVGHFSIIERHRIRITPLPPPNGQPATKP